MGILKKGGKLRAALLNALLTIAALVLGELAGVPVVEPAAEALGSK